MVYDKGIVSVLSKLKPNLSERFGIEKLAIFGSVARGEAHRESDIDIVVLSMKEKNYFTLLRAKTFLEKELKRKVDIGFYDAMKPFIRERIKKDLIYV